uniref:Uncharacterized protein n=1 Tax=Arundo donax TaxID=35708 RepID=A0A0A9EFQ7_ARUDO
MLRPSHRRMMRASHLHRRQKPRPLLGLTGRALTVVGTAVAAMGAHALVVPRHLAPGVTGGGGRTLVRRAMV